MSSQFPLMIILFASSLGIPVLILFILKKSGRVGAIPEDVKSQLENEGLLYIQEGIGFSMRLRNFRAPGRYSSHSIKAGFGAFAISNERIVGYAGVRNCVIDIPFEHPKLAAVEIAIGKRNALCISFEASDFNTQQSGKVELRFGLSNPSEILNQMEKMTSAHANA